jgi:hypothetical protein
MTIDLPTLASFESRDICEEIIRNFNNTPVSKPGQEEHLIQIRYSDTHEQKMLKQQTAAGRVFRAAEYEVGVAQARGMSASDRYLPMSPEEQNVVNEFELFLQGQTYVSTHACVLILADLCIAIRRRICSSLPVTASHGHRPCHPPSERLALPCTLAASSRRLTEHRRTASISRPIRRRLSRSKRALDLPTKARAEMIDYWYPIVARVLQHHFWSHV